MIVVQCCDGGRWRCGEGRETSTVEVRSLLGDKKEIGKGGGMRCILHEMLSHDPDSKASAKLA